MLWLFWQANCCKTILFLSKQFTMSYILIYCKKIIKDGQSVSTIMCNYSLKSRLTVAEYSKSHYSMRLKRIIVLAYTNSVTTKTFKKVSKNIQFDPLISPNVPAVMGMRSQLAASFQCAIYA